MPTRSRLRVEVAQYVTTIIDSRHCFIVSIFSAKNAWPRGSIEKRRVRCVELKSRKIPNGETVPRPILSNYFKWKFGYASTSFTSFFVITKIMFVRNKDLIFLLCNTIEYSFLNVVFGQLEYSTPATKDQAQILRISSLLDESVNLA